MEQGARSKLQNQELFCLSESRGSVLEGSSCAGAFCGAPRDEDSGPREAPGEGPRAACLHLYY